MAWFKPHVNVEPNGTYGPARKLSHAMKSEIERKHRTSRFVSFNNIFTFRSHDIALQSARASPV